MRQVAVLEVGVEDLPPQMVKDVLLQLEEKIAVLLKEKKIPFEKITSFGSSQRIGVLIEGINLRQEDILLKELGPPRNVVYDEKGNLTSAGKRYLMAKGLREEEIAVEKTEKGEYIFIKKIIKGKDTSSILPGLFKELLKGLRFAKTMRWNKEDFSFGRPVRYILSLLGEYTIPFEIAGIKSGRKTKGHRFLYPGFIEVPRAQDYFMSLARKAVIPLPKAREKRILRQISKILLEIQKRGFKPQLTEDRQLLEQTSYLVEHPAVFWGEFDRKYLFLPSFVLKACLREYQRLFTVQEGEKILPFFIGVRDGGRQNLSEIVENNKRVIHARLNDAKFFYEEDRKIPLEKRVPLLKEVFVQEKLGSYYDKVQRIINLNERIFSEFKVDKALKKKIERAAYLCKADILTNMGREFPELQGTIGKEYALLWGEDECVARAIEEHRKPRFAGDTLPSSIEGAILAILDKIDTLCGAFWAGFTPSGSEDPWGLRREAQGTVEILLDRDLDIDLQKLIDESMRLFSSRAKESTEKLKEFFKARIFNILRERGISQDKINAALIVTRLSPTEIAKKAKTLENVSSRKDFKNEAAAIIRVLNILKQANKWGIKIPLNIRENILKEKEEIELYRKWTRIKNTADMLLKQEKYLQAYKKLIQLKVPIHLFFDKVLVMSEDPGLRLNRLALLRQIGSRFLQKGDFTQLQI